MNKYHLPSNEKERNRQIGKLVKEKKKQLMAFKTGTNDDVTHQHNLLVCLIIIFNWGKIKINRRKEQLMVK